MIYQVSRASFSTSTFWTRSHGILDFLKVEKRFPAEWENKRFFHHFSALFPKKHPFEQRITRFPERRFRHRLFGLGPMDYLTFWKSKIAKNPVAPRKVWWAPFDEKSKKASIWAYDLHGFQSVVFDIDFFMFSHWKSWLYESRKSRKIQCASEVFGELFWTKSPKRGAPNVTPVRWIFRDSRYRLF